MQVEHLLLLDKISVLFGQKLCQDEQQPEDSGILRDD